MDTDGSTMSPPDKEIWPTSWINCEHYKLYSKSSNLKHTAKRQARVNGPNIFKFVSAMWWKAQNACFLIIDFDTDWW